MEQKSSSTHALTSTSDLKDSDNVESADSHDSESMNNLKITIHSEKTSITNMEENVDSETSLSSYANKSKAFEVVNMKNTSNSVGPEELLNISSKASEGNSGYGVNGMPSGASSICGKANSDDDVQLINDFHHSELVNKEKEQFLAEEASSSVQISSGEEIMSKSEEACIVEHQMQIEMPRTSRRVSADKSGSTAPEKQQEDIMEFILAQTDKQPLDRKKRKASSLGLSGKKENSGLSNKVHEDLNPGDERTEIRYTAPHGFCKSIKTKETTSLRENGNLNKGEDTSLSERSSDENKMTIKFVNVKATESDVAIAFKDFGTIRKVVFPSVKSTKYKVAHVYFESKKGMEEALKRSDVNIKSTVDLNATSPPIPDLIGYPEVPKSLVKHPSRTVKIKNLKDNVSFHDIEEALAFCKSNITGIFFGSSGAVAYVEFETVEGKEIAIEKHSLIVHGEKLSIFRIDAPRTTIVRISNVPGPARRELISFCKKLGETVAFFTRTFDIMDVHYKVAEWPRMLEIINRLNGFEVGGQQLVAKPAPVYPPHVLDVLWSQQEGRKHLKTVFNSMLLKVGGGTVRLTELVDSFYADVQET
ncbi:unnamed protein product [Withania somnifera]